MVNNFDYPKDLDPSPEVLSYEIAEIMFTGTDLRSIAAEFFRAHETGASSNNYGRAVNTLAMAVRTEKMTRAIDALEASLDLQYHGPED